MSPRIEIVVDRQDFRRWHVVLREELRRVSPGSIVRFHDAGGLPPPRPAVDALLALERLVLRGPRAPLFERTAFPDADTGFDGQPDVVIDCTGREAPAFAPTVPVLRPLFDGLPAAEAMIGALLARRMPDIAIESLGSRAVLARGAISAEAAAGLGGGIESVLSRAILLLGMVLVSPDGFIPGAASRATAAPTGGQAALAFAVRNLARDCARAIYHLCLLAPHWRVGWRLHDGPGVLERGDLGGPGWSVLADPGHRFFADPFPVTWQGRTCVFFEDLDHRVGKGVISAQAFDERGPVGAPVPVLEEPWHLSYPFVTSHAGALWMVPESSLSGTVPIYRCIEFPGRWERAGTLLDGVEAADCTIFRHGDRFWMTATTRRGRGGYSDTLSLFHAERLLGPWEEHRLRPALVDVASARPAGAVVMHEGALMRPIQDCRLGYGRSLAIARIDRLDPDAFAQTIVARVDPGPRWPGGRVHTLNRAGHLECIDGTTYNPRWGALRPFADARMRPRAVGPLETERPPGGDGGLTR